MSHWLDSYVEQLAKHTIQGILLIDALQAIERANSRAVALLGARSEAELVGERLHLGEETGGISLVSMLDAPQTGAVPSGRYLVSTVFGAEFHAQLDVLSRNGDGCMVLLTDLTEQVDLERAVLQSEKLAAMDNIVAGIAHELNNPMTAILGYAELLLASEMEPKRKQRLALIAQEADRCGKIIANMLTYTRSYGKTLEMTNVNAILEEVLSLQAYQLRVDGIKLHSFYDETLPITPLQPSAIRRLFLNLLHNAHQALLAVPAARRNLWAITERRDSTVFIQIADDGPGIPKAIRHRIFDPFFTTRPFGEGMGLGLSVAFGIVHEHKGKIWMEPRVGGGTAIYIELPLPGTKR